MGEWANSKGAVIRNQAHGSPANILDLYAASKFRKRRTDIIRIQTRQFCSLMLPKSWLPAESRHLY